MTNIEPLWDSKKVIEYLGIGKTYFYTKVQYDKDFPKPVKLPGRVKRYFPAEIKQYGVLIQSGRNILSTGVEVSQNHV